MQNYLHGGDIYRRAVELDFSINVNPFGMPEPVRQAAVEGVLQSERYPDWAAEKICRAAAEHFRLPVQAILPGNGAAELIYALTAALRPRQGFVLSPGFLEYEQALQTQGAKIHRIELRESRDYQPASAEILTMLDHMGEGDLLFLCNPNNPTASVLPREQILRILEKVEQQGGYLVMDECFLPFLLEEEALTLVPWLSAYPRLCILRALTKIYAMPGLRLGLLLSENRALLQRIRQQLQPWNVSIPAQTAGEKAFSQRDYVEKTKAYIAAERAWLVEEIRPLCEKLYPGAGNFIFFRAAPALGPGLLAQGILLRDCSSFAGLRKGDYRICVGRHEDNLVLLERWRAWQNPS